MAYPIVLDYDKWPVGCHLIADGADETGQVIYRMMCHDYPPGGAVFKALDWTKLYPYNIWPEIQTFLMLIPFMALFYFAWRRDWL